MKHYKTIFLLVVITTAYTLSATPDSWFKSFYTTTVKPKSLLCITGLVSWGAYLWRMAPEERTYTYHWFQQSYRSVPPLAWYSLLLGSICTYCLVSSRSQSHKIVLPNPLDNGELKGYVDEFAQRIKNLESILEVKKIPNTVITEQKEVIQESIISALTTEMKDVNGRIDELRNRITVLDNQAELQAGQLDKLEQEVFDKKVGLA